MNLKEVSTFYVEKINKFDFTKLVFVMLIVNFLDLISLSLFIPVIESFQGANFTSDFALILSDILLSIGLEPTLLVFLLVICVVFIVKAIFAFWLRYMGAYQASRLQHEIRTNLMKGYTFSKIKFIQNYRQGLLLSVIGEHTNRTSNAYFLFSQIVVQTLTLLVVLVFLFIVSWELTIISVILSFLLIPILRWVGKKTYQNGKEYARNFEDSTHLAHEIIQSKKQISAMYIQPEVNRKFSSISNNVRQTWLWMAFFSNSPAHFVQPFAVIILSLIVLIASIQDMATALAGAFVMAYIRLLPALQSILTMLNDIRAALPSIQRVDDMLRSSIRSAERNSGSNFSTFEGKIKLENISFSHGNEKVLSRISLTIKKGEMVAIIGDSGSGKTTLLDILMGLRSPSSGKISVDGKNLKSISLREYRQKLAYVPQETILFNGTIYDNLTMGLESSISRKKVEEVCRMVGAWDFISKKRGGLDESIGDLGSGLSGGQRQRLAIVKALLREPDLLILDEATSALDGEAEYVVRNAISSIKKDTNLTVVVVTHRYAMIEDANAIHMLSNGLIQDLGEWSKAKAIIGRLWKHEDN